MSAYENLRAACGQVRQEGGRDWPADYLHVSKIDLLEILDELDLLRKAGADPAAKKAKYSPEFELAWAEYPTRPGNSKAAAAKAWGARIKAGATAAQMHEGTQRYAAYCKANGTEPQYIKQAATFYGPGEHYAADWTVTRALTPRRTAPEETPEQQAARRNRWGLGGLGGDGHAKP